MKQPTDLTPALVKIANVLLTAELESDERRYALWALSNYFNNRNERGEEIPITHIRYIAYAAIRKEPFMTKFARIPMMAIVELRALISSLQ